MGSSSEYKEYKYRKWRVTRYYNNMKEELKICMTEDEFVKIQQYNEDFKNQKFAFCC